MTGIKNVKIGRNITKIEKQDKVKNLLNNLSQHINQ